MHSVGVFGEFGGIEHELYTMTITVEDPCEYGVFEPLQPFELDGLDIKIPLPYDNATLAYAPQYEF